MMMKKPRGWVVGSPAGKAIWHLRHARRYLIAGGEFGRADLMALLLMAEAEARVFASAGRPMPDDLKQFCELICKNIWPDSPGMPPRMTRLEAKEEARSRWGTAAHVQYDGMYQLSCAVGFFRPARPGDHRRYEVCGLARDWNTAFDAADLHAADLAIHEERAA